MTIIPFTMWFRRKPLNSHQNLMIIKSMANRDVLNWPLILTGIIANHDLSKLFLIWERYGAIYKYDLINPGECSKIKTISTEQTMQQKQKLTYFSGHIGHICKSLIYSIYWLFPMEADISLDYFQFLRHWDIMFLVEGL